MTMYLKNTSGSLVNIIDLGISLPTGQSIVIDSNAINAYLTSDLTAKITAGDIILSTTDIGDNGGDLSITDAIAALSITSRFDRDNPHSTTITQALAADSSTTITVTQLNDLTDGGETNLHIHDDRYYTENELSTSNPATVNVHWDNIINAPSFGSLHWRQPVKALAIEKGSSIEMNAFTAIEGHYWWNTDDDHLYRYTGSSWVDTGAPQTGDRFIWWDGVDHDDHIYEFNGTSWFSATEPINNYALIVDDYFGRAVQFIYDDTMTNPPNWVKLADVTWGDHNSLDGRSAEDAHPATSISYNNISSGLGATTLQSAIDELSLENKVDLNNIVFVAKNGVDINVNVDLGTIANPYLTIQAAIDSITGASSTNRYVVYVMPGDYNENVVLNKAFVYIASSQKSGTRITSSSGNTLTLSSTTEKAIGVYNISLVSNSSSTTDNALYITGNNPTLFNVDMLAPSGARTAYVNAAYAQTFRHVDLREGEFRIDAGVIEFYDSKTINALANITGGTLRVHNGDFSHNGGDAISQSGGTVYLISSHLSSGSGAKDYNQAGGTVYWGWVEYNANKTVFSGTKTLLFPAGDLYYNSTGDVNITGDTVAQVIAQIDVLVTDMLINSTAHENNINNPHSVTFTQASFADPDTDITALEAEVLTDGSNADLLHKHNASNIDYDNTGTDLVAVNVQSAINELESNSGKRFHSRIYVDKHRTDIYTPTGSQSFPYKTILAATTVATNGVVIFVSEGTYVENIVLPEGSGLIGAGTSKTYLEGTLTTTNKALSKLEDFSIYGNMTLTGRSQLQNIYSNAQVFINGVTDPASIEALNVTIGANTGVALVIGDNVELAKFSSGAISSKDGSSAITSESGVIVFDKNIIEVRIVTSTNPGLLFSGTSTIQIHQSLIQTTGGKAITSIATNTIPNLISDVLHASSGMVFNNSPTVVEGVHDLMGGQKIPTGNALIKRPGEQIDYTNTTSGLVASNVQTAIDELSDKISQFDMPQGTVFPTLPAPDAGDMFYRTDLNMTFQYDSSRSKWLSITQMFLDWGSAVADGKYLNIHGAVATQTGYLMPYNGTIISLTAKIASGNQSKTLELRRNNDRNNILDTFTLASGSYTSTTKNIDFDAGDYMQAFVPSSGVPAKDAVVMAVIAWRG